MIGSAGTSGKAEDLRREFDLSFAQPALAASRATVDLMLMRVGAQIYAIRLGGIAAIRAYAKTTPCPSRIPAFSGLAAVRGVMMPVWDLATLLGHSRGAGIHWLVIPAAAPLAFRFDEFDRHLRVDPDAIRPGSDETRGHIREILEDAGTAVPVIDVASVIAAIKESVKNAVT